MSDCEQVSVAAAALPSYATMVRRLDHVRVRMADALLPKFLLRSREVSHPQTSSITLMLTAVGPCTGLTISAVLEA